MCLVGTTSEPPERKQFLNVLTHVCNIPDSTQFFQTCLQCVAKTILEAHLHFANYVIFKMFLAQPDRFVDLDNRFEKTYLLEYLLEAVPIQPQTAYILPELLVSVDTYDMHALPTVSGAGGNRSQQFDNLYGA